MNFDLHRLRLLRELSHRETLSAVAQALSYSPAAISQQLSLLQSEVGVRLLEPDGRRVRLTAEAQILVAHAEAVFSRLEQAEADIVRSQQRIKGTVRVAAFQTAMLVLVPRALTILRDTHPALRVEVTQAEPELARSALLPRDFDLVIDEVYPGYPQQISARLDQQPLTADPIRLACPRAIGAARELRDHTDSPWVMEPPGSPAREWTVATCRKAGFEPDIVYESTDIVVHTRLVEAGHAVAFLPDLLTLERSIDAAIHQVSRLHRRRIVTTCRSSARDHPAILVLRKALQVASRPGKAPSPAPRDPKPRSNGAACGGRRPV